jgi:hypothetical protein
MVANMDGTLYVSTGGTVVFSTTKCMEASRGWAAWHLAQLRTQAGRTPASLVGSEHAASTRRLRSSRQGRSQCDFVRLALVTDAVRGQSGATK